MVGYTIISTLVSHSQPATLIAAINTSNLNPTEVFCSYYSGSAYDALSIFIKLIYKRD